MIQLTKLSATLGTAKISGFTTTEFLHIHRHMEGYLKRVLLIGLRLKSVKYKDAEFIVDRIHLDIASTIDKCLYLLDGSGSTQGVYINGLKARHSDLFVLINIFVKFCSKYRNQVAHGIIGDISSQEALDVLCHVNLSLYKEFERVLMAEHSCSAFDEPKAWGASRGRDEDHLVTITRLRLGNSLAVAPQKVSDVKTALQSTGYPKP
ncbi:hypothetical protein M5264_004115 [Vibrio vulnificus]|nr:hypothetical protein [Vibrio vulnificus]